MSREKLQEILHKIIQNSPQTTFDSNQCRGLLLDNLKGWTTIDVSYLVSPIEKGVVAQMLNSLLNSKSDCLKEDSILMLQSRSNLQKNDAEWVVDTWLKVLESNLKSLKDHFHFIPSSPVQSHSEAPSPQKIHQFPFPTESIAEHAALVKWIEQSGDSELKKLVKLAQKGKPLPSQKLQKLISSLINDPQDLYGKTMASQSVKHHANLTASCTNIANLLDFASNFSFFHYAFSSLINPIDLVLSLLSNSLLLVFSNKTATIAANKTRHGHIWSKVGLGTMIALATLKSSVSGVGGELFMNQPELRKILAQELIDEEQAKVTELKELSVSPQLEATRQELKKQEAELATIGDDRSHPLWDSTYRKINGSYTAQLRGWSQVPLEQLPLSEKVKRLEAKESEKYTEAKSSLETKLVKRSQISNDLIFLQQEMPNAYAANFDLDGEIASGTKAVELAMVNFFNKLISGQWQSLGFSLFFFSLSVLSSAASVFLTIKYADRKDVQQSQIQEEKAAKLAKEWLTQKWFDAL